MLADKKPTEPRTTEPASLLSQWWSLGAIALDRRTKGRHIKVGWVIIERYMRNKGGGRASIRFIQQATGLSGHIVVKACNELVEWGYSSRVVGTGTRPTEYMPSWAIVSPLWNTKTLETSAPQECNAIAPQECNANGASVSPMCSESFLRNRLTKPSYSKEDIISHGALSGAAPAAVAPGVPEGARVPEAQSGFDEFWKLFPKKLKKVKARLAYEKLAPDSDLHARIIEKVKELAAHHKEQGTEFKWIREPANWLSGEGWDEDLPAVYQDPKDAAISKRKAGKRATPTPANSNVAVAANWESVEVVASEVVERPKGNALVATLRSGAGDTIVEEITLEHANQTEQDRGQKQFEKLRWAMDLNVIDDSSELHGIPFERRVYNGKPEYRAPAKDVAA